MNKIKWKQFLLRLQCCRYILFRPKDSWAFIGMDSNNLIALLEDKAIDAQIIRHKLQEYNFYTLVKKIGGSKDDVAMLLARLQFENETAEYIKSRGKK